MWKTNRFLGVGLAVYLLSALSTQAAGQEINVAVGGTASQSTTGFGGVPARAIDGNTSGAFGDGSITHTDTGDAAPSWEVDLGDVFSLTRIVIWNRTDACCPHRLSNFRVLVLDAARAVVFSGDFFTDIGRGAGDIHRRCPAAHPGSRLRGAGDLR